MVRHREQLMRHRRRAEAQGRALALTQGLVPPMCASPEKTDTQFWVFLGVRGVGFEGRPSISVNIRRVYALQTPEMPVPMGSNRQKMGLS